MDKDEFLQRELDAQIGRFEVESTKHKKMYRGARYTVFFLAAASTALASLAIACPDIQAPINLAIIVLTAIMGVVTSIEGLRKPGDLWIHERVTYYALQDLKRDLEYGIAGGSARTDEMFERLQLILGSSGEKWNRLIAGRQAADVKPDATKETATGERHD